jgi:diketogulonate reductase-like aldo/keto reductase
MESIMLKNTLLNDGHTMPFIGLGTADAMHDVPPPKWVINRFTDIVYKVLFFRLRWLYRSIKFIFTVKNAINSGDKMIDTSSSYRNAFFIRIGIFLSNYNREDLFLITRISNQEQWNSSVRESLNKSLKQFNTDYIDLFMFHWPVPDKFLETWKEMEIVHKEGLAKSIGVANCHKHHLEKIFDIATVLPSVNEFEIHPLMSQNELVQYCVSKGISPIAYTPIGRMHEKITNNNKLKKIADTYSKSIPQIILRWHTQRNISAIPRSIKTKNISANLNIFDFELNSCDIEEIDSINEDLRLRFDPDNCDFTKL